MQRFKNLTKKSGKVASAILSAAMVTSMVLGTNVVEVKAENIETTTDVQAGTTVNSDVTVARAAKTDFIEAVKNLPVNTTTAGNEKDFTDPIKDAKDKYDLLTGNGIEIDSFKITKDPTDTKDGEKTLKFTVKTATHTEKGEVVYKLDSFKTRAEKMEKAINEKLDKLSVNSTTDKAKIQNEIAKLADEKGDTKGIKIYSDYKLTPSTDIEVNNFKKDSSKRDSAVDISADIVVKYDNTNVPTATGIDARVTMAKKIDSNQKRANDAAAAVKKYLQNDARQLDATTATTGGVVTLVNDYLQNDYPDVQVNQNDVAMEVKVKDAPSQTVDGSATVKFRVATTGATEIAFADVDTTEVTLLSDESKVNKGLADLLAIAEKVAKDVDNDTVAYNGSDNFNDSYDKIFEDKLNDELKAYLPAGKKFDCKTIPNIIGGFENLYTGADASFAFIAKDASADKDGQPKVVFSVNSNGETDSKSYTYTIKSTQSTVDAAKTAVEKALADMTITNDTTQADVEAVVDAAIKDYDGVKAEVVFVPTKATADKEGTADITVKLTDTKNGITKEAIAHKTFSFLSNTFVVKDGKKFYYDKNGNLLKNTFLQGTDSPDGYTYYIQNDGSVMQDRLTYHPNGKDVIYFDADGHEVFDAFVNVKKDVQGNAVDYIGYFGTLGGAYVNQTTYGNGVGAYSKDALFYINDYGVLENKGWFQNAAGNIGYAAANGTLTTSQWSLDQFGRKVYFQANGFLAKGLMTDGVKTYQLDETDGHLVGEF